MKACIGIHGMSSHVLSKLALIPRFPVQNLSGITMQLTVGRRIVETHKDYRILEALRKGVCPVSEVVLDIYFHLPCPSLLSTFPFL